MVGASAPQYLFTDFMVFMEENTEDSILDRLNSARNRLQFGTISVDHIVTLSIRTKSPAQTGAAAPFRSPAARAWPGTPLEPANR